MSFNKVDECENFMNGIMKKGLSNTIQAIYFYQTNQLMKVDGITPKDKTEKYIKELQSDEEL